MPISVSADKMSGIQQEVLGKASLSNIEHHCGLFGRPAFTIIDGSHQIEAATAAAGAGVIVPSWIANVYRADLLSPRRECIKNSDLNDIFIRDLMRHINSHLATDPTSNVEILQRLAQYQSRSGAPPWKEAFRASQPRRSRCAVGRPSMSGLDNRCLTKKVFSNFGMQSQPTGLVQQESSCKFCSAPDLEWMH